MGLQPENFNLADGEGRFRRYIRIYRNRHELNLDFVRRDAAIGAQSPQGLGDIDDELVLM